jgi:hypothetical protein
VILRESIGAKSHLNITGGRSFCLSELVSFFAFFLGFWTWIHFWARSDCNEKVKRRFGDQARKGNEDILFCTVIVGHAR